MDPSKPTQPREDYRRFQRIVVPGVDSLNRTMRAILDSALPDGASILIVGAGGGREIEALGTSPRSYRMLGVDPADDMLAMARAQADAMNVSKRVQLVCGMVDDLSDRPHDAATSMFVMHFVPVGEKAPHLRQIRNRLRPGAPYLHVDVCYNGPEDYERLAPVYARHAEMGGLPPEQAADLAVRVGTMPVTSEAATLDYMTRSGFRLVSPFFRGLWYAGWWLEAV